MAHLKHLSLELVRPPGPKSQIHLYWAVGHGSSFPGVFSVEPHVITEELVAPGPGPGRAPEDSATAGESPLRVLHPVQLRAVVGQDPDLSVPQFPHPQHGLSNNSPSGCCEGSVR